MPQLIVTPATVEACGEPPKIIQEDIGCVNSGDHAISVARMSSPEGWNEPGQRPEFREITLVLKGVLHIEHEGGLLKVPAGHCSPG